MKHEDKRVDGERRRFLGQAAAAGAGTVVAASVPGAAIGAAADQPDQESGVQKGYRLTRHVLDYYKSAAS